MKISLETVFFENGVYFASLVEMGKKVILSDPYIFLNVFIDFFL